MVDHSHQAPFTHDLVMIGAHHPDRIGQTPQEPGRQIGPKQKRLNHVRPLFLHEFPQVKQDPKVKFSGSVQADHPYAPPAKLLHQASAAFQGTDCHIELRAVDARRQLDNAFRFLRLPAPLPTA